MMQILLIEDNRLSQAESLLASLKSQDVDVAVVHTPQTAAKQTESLWPNLVVFNAAKCKLKLSNVQKAVDKINLDIPYVVVVDKKAQPNEADGDTLFVAPGNPKGLQEGIRKATSKQKDRFLRLPDLILDCQQRQLLQNKQIYHLTPKEFSLLFLLVDNKDQDISRRVIMKKVWETDYMGDTRTLDVHIRWLREKIEENPSRPRRLVTIRGVGYRFISQPE